MRNSEVAEHIARIAIVLPSLTGGGAERINLLLAAEFVRRGYSVDLVLVQATGELISEVPEYVRVIDLNSKRLRNAVLPLRRYLDDASPGAVLAAMWPLTAIVGTMKVLGYGGCKIVISEHNTLSYDVTMNGVNRYMHRVLGKLVYAAVDGVVAVSNGAKRDLSKITGFNEDRIRMINNPVKLPVEGSVADAVVMSNWIRGSDRIIAVGSFKRQKDFPNLLNALVKLRATRDARLLILGEGALRSELERLASDLGIGPYVTMPGFKKDTYPYLEHADLFALSSAWEGLPGVLIEALVAGVPVVSTDCPSGPAEILENGKYGRLVPVGDPEALAAAMAESLNATHDRDMLRRRGNEFSVERAADQYLALLDPGGKMLAGT